MFHIMHAYLSETGTLPCTLPGAVVHPGDGMPVEASMHETAQNRALHIDRYYGLPLRTHITGQIYNADVIIFPDRVQGRWLLISVNTHLGLPISGFVPLSRIDPAVQSCSPIPGNI